jgi:hypothetical protein
MLSSPNDTSRARESDFKFKKSYEWLYGFGPATHLAFRLSWSCERVLSFTLQSSTLISEHGSERSCRCFFEAEHDTQARNIPSLIHVAMLRNTCHPVFVLPHQVGKDVVDEHSPQKREIPLRSCCHTFLVFAKYDRQDLNITRVSSWRMYMRGGGVEVANCVGIAWSRVMLTCCAVTV